MKRSIKKNWPRLVLGWGVIVALVLFLTGIIPSQVKADPEAYCPMGGLEALGTYFVRGSLPCSMSSLQIIMGIALAGAVVLFCRLFCGYLCPIGTVQDLMTRLRTRLRIPAMNVNCVVDKVLRVAKYALLFVIFWKTLSASELFCKYIDPYYAAATGFKGENVTGWICGISFTAIFLGGFFIKNFFCKYLCPLGAISGAVKFWVWVAAYFGLWYLLTGVCGLEIHWLWCLGGFCLLGYLLEVLCGRPRAQLLKVHRNEAACNHCGLCEKKCPMGIEISEFNGSVNHVDCTLCGECVASCNKKAMAVAVVGQPVKHLRFLPAILTVVIAVAAAIVGSKYIEIPTISETWGIEKTLEDGTVEVLVPSSQLKSFTMSGLRSVKCFGSSKAFMSKLMRIPGVHGVKTYVKSHRAEITYDTKRISQEEIEKKIFVPSAHKVTTPDPKQIDSIRVITLLTEGMSDKLDVNYFSLQLRFSEFGDKIYGVDSEFSCPLTVHVYIDPTLEVPEGWWKQIVNKKEVVFPQTNPDKPTKTIEVNSKFVSQGPDAGMISTADFLHKMFSGFHVEWKQRYEKAAATGAAIHVYEFVDPAFEKPILSRNMPFVSNTLSQHEGVASVSLALNAELLPSIQIEFFAPMTADEIWSILSAETWRIDYRNEKGIVDEPAKIKFKAPGVVVK